MKNEDKWMLDDSIENEGFDYFFRFCSDCREIKDEEFHRLRIAYVKAAELLEDYIKPEEEEDGEQN